MNALVDMSLDELAGIVNEHQDTVRARASERGLASQRLKEAQKIRDQAVEALCARYREDHGIQQTLNFDGEADDGEDEDDDG